VGFKGFPDTLEGKAMLKQQSNFDQGFGKSFHYGGKGT